MGFSKSALLSQNFLAQASDTERDLAVFLEPSGCHPALDKMGPAPALPKTTADDNRSDADLYNLERTTLSLA